MTTLITGGFASLMLLIGIVVLVLAAIFFFMGIRSETHRLEEVVEDIKEINETLGNVVHFQQTLKEVDPQQLMEDINDFDETVGELNKDIDEAVSELNEEINEAVGELNEEIDDLQDMVQRLKDDLDDHEVPFGRGEGPDPSPESSREGQTPEVKEITGEEREETEVEIIREGQESPNDES